MLNGDLRLCSRIAAVEDDKTYPGTCDVEKASESFVVQADGVSSLVFENKLGTITVSAEMKNRRVLLIEVID